MLDAGASLADVGSDQVNAREALNLRDKMVQILEAGGRDEGRVKNWDEIIDSAVYRPGSSLRMVGSHKVCNKGVPTGAPPYRLLRSYTGWKQIDLADEKKDEEALCARMEEFSIRASQEQIEVFSKSLAGQ